MTLSTRLVVEPSPVVRRLETASVAGGVMATLATVGARAMREPGTIELALLAGATLSVFALVVLRPRRIRSPRAVLAIDASDEVRLDADDDIDDLDPAPVRLHASSTLWPSFAVLRFQGVARPVFIVDAALAHDDARRVRRWLLWLARGGARSRGSSDRPSR